jgi:diguanylate cyclase (GGDEF)-like protein
VAQALGWASFLSAAAINDRLLSSLWVALVGASMALTWLALQAWMGPRPGGRLLAIATVITPLGYAIGFDHYAFRVGWSNAGLALQMAIVCVALAWRAPQSSRRWRALVFGALAVMALLTLWRGVLGAFFTAAYPHFRAPHAVNLASALLSPIALVLSTLGLLVAWHEEADRELRSQANHDSLTGLLNRRAFAERAAALMAQARRYDTPLALLLIDIDHFKAINDRLGHAGGDRALQTLGRALRESLRGGDIAGRHGGEEFCVLLFHADAIAAGEYDRRLRRMVGEHAETAELPSLRFSAGLAMLRADDRSIEPLVARADDALYQAKSQGRDRTVEFAPAIVAASS